MEIYQWPPGEAVHRDSGFEAWPWGGDRKVREGGLFQATDSSFADGLATESDSVFALDVLRQRLHEKIREAQGQVGMGRTRVPGAGGLLR